MSTSQGRIEVALEPLFRRDGEWLLLHIERLPESGWIGIETVTNLSADGIGTSSGTLHDLRGPVAYSHTALYVAPRPS